MKDYRIGMIFCECSKRMDCGKRVKIYQHTPTRKKCPHCRRNRTIMAVNPPVIENVPRSIMRRMMGSRKFKRLFMIPEVI